MSEKLPNRRRGAIGRSPGWVPAVLLLMLAYLVSPAGAQETETSKEFWPEIDVYVQVKPRVRLFFLATVSKAVEDGELFQAQGFEAQYGAHVDFIPNKHMIFRTGYRYGTSIGDNSDPFKENRILTEQTFRKMLPGQILLSDRNREDFRFINGDFSFRYRNRVTLEREFRLFKKWPTTPYTSGEIYYDTRYQTWNRNRYAVGVQQSFRGGPLSRMLLPEKQVILDIYFMRQNDSRSSTPHVNALGLSLAFYF